MEEGWERRRETIALDPRALDAAVAGYAGPRPFTLDGPLAGGLVNQSYRVRLREPSEDAVLRVYLRDPDAAAKEAAVLARIADAVRAPRVLHRDAVGPHPCAVTTWIPGGALAAFFAKAQAEAGARAAHEAGAAAARLHAFGVEHMGFLDGRLTVPEPMPGLRRTFHATMRPLIESGRPRAHLGAGLARDLLAFLGDGLGPLEEIEGRYAIVHGDFKPTNVFVDGRGALTGLLDWEFAWAGPPLIDLGQMLRWPVPPGFEDAFAQGYRLAGGTLPAAWRTQARLLDLLNLITFLDTPQERPVLTRDVKRMIRETIAVR